MCRRAIPLSVVAVLFACPLFAAPVPPAPKPDDSVSPGAAKLLQHRKIQKELKMTAEHRVVIFDGLADIEEDYEKKINDLSRMPNANEEQYTKLDKDRRTAVEKLLGDSATKSLNANQRKRLHQLDWRLRGVAAFADPKVEKLLQLTEAQKKKSAEFAERQKGAVDSIINGNGNDDGVKRRADLFAARADLLKQMEATLTADQKTAWAALLGEAPTGFVVDDLWLKIEEEFDLLVPGGGGIGG